MLYLYLILLMKSGGKITLKPYRRICTLFTVVNSPLKVFGSLKTCNSVSIKFCPLI